MVRIDKKLKRYLQGGGLALLTYLLMLSLSYLNTFQALEWKADDVKTEWLRAGTTANQEVVVLLVDEASISMMEEVAGRWPWVRSIWADVLEYLTMGGANSVAFDILFTERSQPVENGQVHLYDDHDTALIDMTAEAGMVTHAIQILHDPSNPDPKLPLPAVFAERFQIPNVTGVPPSQNDTFYIPMKPLQQAAKHMGVVEFVPDKDGVYRRTNLIRDYLGLYYPVLSTSSLMEKLPFKQVVEDTENRVLYIDDKAIPLDRNLHYQVKFYEHFESISIGSVLASLSSLRQGNMEALYTNERLVPPEFFENKVVFIGTSAVGTEDLKNTPINARWPGVFLHAAIASNILNNDFTYQIDQAWLILILFLASFLTAVIVLMISSVVWQVVYPMMLAASYVAFNVWIQAEYDIQMDLVTPVLTAFLTWLLLSAYLAATEGRERKRVKNMLGQYVSPAALNTVLDNYENQIEAEVGKEENMSIVFSDVRSFTTISEGLAAADVVKLLNIHLDAMTQITFDHGGTMDKFIGDATMAFWGAPLPDDDHALHATQAAIQMYRAMSRVNATLEENGLIPIAIGVGVNTGRVILGNIGSSQKLDYTVIGDAVNLGSRLEGLTKQYGVGVLISEFTQADIAQQIPCALVDLVRVKGKNKPVKIYTPLADKEDETLAEAFELVAQCEQAFEYYHACQFEQAKTIFERLPDYPFEKFKAIYVERCNSYLETPPEEGWDGVFTLTTK